MPGCPTGWKPVLFRRPEQNFVQSDGKLASPQIPMKNSFMPLHRVIAIDGPAASGKSSVAFALAQRLGFSYVNSGAMYRAVTWHILQRGVNVHEPAAVVAAVDRSRIVCDLIDNQSR